MRRLVFAAAFAAGVFAPHARASVIHLHPIDDGPAIFPDPAPSNPNESGGFTQVEPSQPSNLGSFAINIVAGTTLAANTAALDAFNRAAAQWEAFISDPITVNIDADLANLGNPSVIGQASSVTLVTGYDQIRDAMVADAAAETDDAIVASLPTAAQFNAILPAGFGLDGDLGANKANLKALGFTGLDATFGATDATITFNTTFSFDYDNSDGVTPGTMDFETVAAHEIGHALGFVSIVDEIDFLVDNGNTADVAPRTLDLFRFDNDGVTDPVTPTDFTSFDRSLVPNNDEVFDDLTSEWAFSTGSFTGDGRQASHWKDDGLTGSNLGILDPTLSFGQVFAITGADLRALDLIGYDIVSPEPASTLIMATLGMMFLLARPTERRVLQTQTAH